MRRKTVLSVILPAAALALVLSFASCSPAGVPDDSTSGTEAATAADTGGGPAPEKTMYKITFATSGGSYIAPRRSRGSIRGAKGTNLKDGIRRPAKNTISQLP